MICSRIKERFMIALMAVFLISTFSGSKLFCETSDFLPQYSLNGGFTVISTGSDYTEIEFILPDYDLIPVEVDGVTYYRIIHPEAGFIMNEGLPELSSFSTGLSIPITGIAELGEISIKETNILKGMNIFPSQGFDLKISEEKGFVIDTGFYDKDTSYPQEFALVSTPAVMRDIRLISLTVNPFVYNPARQELEIIKRMTVKIDYNTSVRGENEINNTRQRRSRSFENVYRNTALNYGQFRNPDSEYQQRSILVVHHHTTDAQYQNLINQLVSWKRDKGFEIAAVSTAGMSQPQQIKNYIQNAYNTWEHPPEYIIIVGGKTGAVPVPVWTIYDSDAYIPGNSDGDHSYTTLEGGDILPDAFIGRLSISSVEQLATAWAKIRNYERTPYFEEDNNWHNHNLLVGDPGVSGVSTIITNRYIKELILSHNGSKTLAEVYTPPYATQMQNGINQGVSYFSFRGIENFAGWPAPADGDLYNGLKTPHSTIITCRTLDFSGGKQVCRLFRMGTPANPKGIITGIGMSWVTETAFNNCLTGGIYHGIFVGGQRTMGEATVNGKLNQWITYNNSHAWQLPRYFHQTNLIGDPSLEIWVETPEPMTVTYPQTLPPGSNSIRIIVTDSEEQPVKNAWVTIRQVNEDDELFATGYTDTTGKITHFFDEESAGEIKVTVTNPSHIPHLGSFEITGEAAVTYESVNVIGSLNAGNEVNFTLRIKNHRNTPVTDVNGTISTVSEYINITEDNADFGNIGAGGTAQSADQFTIGLAPNTPAGHQAHFDLTIADNQDNSWISRFVLRINNGSLMPVDLVIVGDDNDDGVLDPDERATVRVYLRNVGNINLSGIRGTLSGGGYGLDYINDTTLFGNINVNQTVTSIINPFFVETADFLLPGMILDLTLVLENEDGFHQEHIVKLPIGSPTIDDPLGPDSYGYWCYDSGDTGYEDAPVYDWIEIAPVFGGSGTNTNLYADFDNSQNIIVMDLPFPFRFYGREYDEITICANGWVSLGVTEQATQRNWRLPGPLGPSPIIAAFWDNLSLGAGGVFTWYDEVNSKFVIQWQNARNVIGNAEETFQIILYNPAFYHTATADGPIKIQYKVFNNLNNGANNPTGIGNWGNYATVGIADHTSTVGLEYTFNNQYPTAARPIENETALYFTTGSVTNAPYISIESFSFSDDDNDLPEYGDSGNISITLQNIGGQDAQGVTAILSSSDEYVSIINNYAEFGNIPSGENSNVNDAYTIEIAPETPNGHKIFFNLNIIEENDIDWNFRFYLPIKAPHIAIDSLTVSRLPIFNETVSLNMSLENVGESDSRNVAAVLSSEDEYITIFQDRAEYDDICIEASSHVNNAYTIRIAANVPNLHQAAFNLDITSEGGQSWKDTFYLQLYAPDLISSTPTVFDPLPGGNNNGMIDPGETVTIFLPLINEGGANSPPVLIDVEPVSDLVTVNEITPTGFHTVPTGLTIYPSVNITVSENAVAGTPLPFNYLYQAGEYEFRGNFLLGVGGIIPAQMGYGNARTTSQTASPINIYYRSLRGQMIYTAQELYDAGITAGGQINQLGFYVVSTPEYPLLNFTVRMRHIDAEDASEHIEGDLETVYHNAAFTPVAEGWAMMNFSDPFDWNGTDNILIDTAFSPVEGWSGSGQIKVYHASNGFRFTRADNFDQTNVATTTTSTDKPQAMIIFGIDADDLATRPQNLSAEFSDEQISLSWLPPQEFRNSSNVRDRRIAGTSHRYDHDNYRNPLGYNIYRNGVRINSELVPETHFADNDFNPYIDNFYYTTAVFHSSESPPSNIVKAEIDVVAHLQVTPEDTIQYDRFQVTITSDTEDARIHYTLDGSQPTLESYLYYDSFEIDYHTTLKARGFKDNWITSEMISIDYFVLYAPQNIRSSGSLATANLYWDEPYSQHKRSSSAETRIMKSFDYHTRQSNDKLRSPLRGYNIYRSFEDEEFVLINPSPVNETEYEDTGLQEGAYRYYVTAVYEKGHSQPSRTVNVTIGTTTVEDEDLPVYPTELLAAYPNPFNPETIISFTLSSEEKVSIDIYNILGKRVGTVINEILPAGKHKAVWDGTDNNGQRVSSGIYFYRMQTHNYQAVKKIIMLK